MAWSVQLDVDNARVVGWQFYITLHERTRPSAPKPPNKVAKLKYDVLPRTVACVFRFRLQGSDVVRCEECDSEPCDGDSLKLFDECASGVRAFVKNDGV